jgi:uncharacterized protein YjiS (DUF1127 family)
MLFSTLMEIYRDWRRYNAGVSELSSLSERELADIGISRADIYRVGLARLIDPPAEWHRRGTPWNHNESGRETAYAETRLFTSGTYFGNDCRSDPPVMRAAKRNGPSIQVGHSWGAS